MVKIKHSKISGSWRDGFALDLHTTSSEFMGYDEFGHPVFDTQRSEIGELLYRLKFKADKSVLDEILETVINFLNNTWKISNTLDGVIPVPPSNVAREFQPVMEIAEKIGNNLGIPVYKDLLVKTKGTPELKNVYDYQRRLEILQDAFTIKASLVKGKNILLFDDLYRSGATINAVSDILYKKGMVSSVDVLTLTRTRRKNDKSLHRWLKKNI